jgi:6-pyruvoyltetrahydropterin/6-carboxytetrahydropterin synthase
VGRVIDFGLVKKIIGGWIDENWDHNMLLNSNDPLALEDDEARLCLVGREPFLMPKESNPTAEVMVEVLFKTAEILLPQYLVVKKVRLYETPNCYAEYPSE